RIGEFESHGLSFYDPNRIASSDTELMAAVGASAWEYRSTVNVLCDSGDVILSQSYDDVIAQ
ncbi:MAG: hypothetical protein JSV90_09040, partial [Methanobacteriota archaeon]